VKTQVLKIGDRIQCKKQQPGEMDLPSGTSPVSVCNATVVSPIKQGGFDDAPSSVGRGGWYRPHPASVIVSHPSSGVGMARPTQAKLAFPGATRSTNRLVAGADLFLSNSARIVRRQLRSTHGCDGVVNRFAPRRLPTKARSCQRREQRPHQNTHQRRAQSQAKPSLRSLQVSGRP
jgi:hypothetical protein